MEGVNSNGMSHGLGMFMLRDMHVLLVTQQGLCKGSAFSSDPVAPWMACGGGLDQEITSTVLVGSVEKKDGECWLDYC